MSAQLQHKAAAEASFLNNIRKPLFSRVPPIPSTVNLQGQTAIITGSSSGLGLEAARQFLAQGVAHIVLAVRSQARGDTAAADLRSEFPTAKIEVWLLDMESEDSVRAFARRCESMERLDIAILSAGVTKVNFEKSNGGEGREVTLQVNYLSTILLSLLLVPILRAKAVQGPGRLTVVGSDNAHWHPLPVASGSLIDAVDNAESYEGMKQYSWSKLFLIMAIAKLSEIVSPDEVIVNYLNPCATRGTGLAREATGIVKIIVSIMSNIVGRAPVDGARQYLHATAVLGKESHGSWTDFAIRPYPVLMYTKDGRQGIDALWKQTLAELELSVEDITD